MFCYYCSKKIEVENAIEGLHGECFAKWFELEKPQRFTHLTVQSMPSNAGEYQKITNSFFHGKFRKYSASLGQKSFILKVQQVPFPELPAVEYLCNQIASVLQVQVPHHYLVRLEGKLDTSVVYNFMQDYPASNLVHIYRFLKSAKDYTVKAIMNILQYHIGRKADMDRFAELCLFDAFIGNHDRHGRNIAIIDKNPEKILAPPYDNPSYIGMEIPELLGAHH